MPKKLGLVLCWLTGTLALLLITSFYFYTYSHPLTISQQHPTKIAEELPENHFQDQVLGVQITDKRAYTVSNFLKKTPLEPYSSYIVETSDKYGIDYRLIPAIAVKETGGGRTANEDSYNAWGFENGRTKWGSWEEAIDTVAKTLKTRYIDKGYTTPDEIMPIYAPPAVENGGGWAIAINSYFLYMDEFLESL